MDITDEMCERAILALEADRIQGFSYGEGFGPPHVIRDVRMPYGKQELWRGQDHGEMMRRIEIIKMRLALTAALDQKHGFILGAML